MNLFASLLNLDAFDLIVVLVLVLLIFGAKKLPGLAKGLGQTILELRKRTDEFRGVEVDAEAGEPQAQADGSRTALPAGAWVLLPLGIVTALSCLGVLTREEVLALLITLLLFWVAGKLGRAS